MKNKTPLIDEKTFFHEATVKICGTLEIDKALSDFFHYAKQYIPVESVYITRVFSAYREFEVMAKASAEGCDLLHERFNITEAAWQVAKEHGLLDQSRETVIAVNDPEDPMWKYVSKIPTLNILHLPTLVITFFSQGDSWFSVSMVGKEGGRYSQEHVDLAMSLRPPLLVALNNYLRHDELRQLKEQIAADNLALRQKLSGVGPLNIIGETAGLKATMDQVRQVAPTDAPVLLSGETGTGKELLARAIHNLSQRSRGPFVTVNCAAIPPSLIDSELFGHVKGAFTGATTDRKGRFERADTGTIFLDEIGELPLNVQSRLLRVIQEQEIERVGGSEIIEVNNRIIAATHRDLQLLSEEGSFRRDLFFRLRVFPIEIPPLRERVHDIPALVHHFIVEKSSKMGRLAPPVSHGELETIMSWPWKGNVRELENAVEEALIRSPEGPLYFTRPDIAPSQQAPDQQVRHPSFDKLVSEYFAVILKATNGKIKGPGNAADVMGLNPSTLRAKLRKYKIPFGRKADK